MKKLAFSLCLLATFVALWSSAQDSGGFQIVVNSATPVSELAKRDVSNIFLKKKSRWENGDNAIPIDLSSNSPVREAFSRAVHGRSVSSIKNYWQRQIFSGREVPPQEAASNDDVIRFVGSNPGAIGYVSQGTSIPASVKVLNLTD